MADHIYFKITPESALDKLITEFSDGLKAVRQKQKDYANERGAFGSYGRSGMVVGLAFKEKPTEPGWRRDRKNKHLDTTEVQVYCPDTPKKEGKQREAELQALQAPTSMQFDSKLRELIDPASKNQGGFTVVGPHRTGGFPVEWCGYVVQFGVKIIKVPISFEDHKPAVDPAKVKEHGGEEMPMSEVLELAARDLKEKEANGREDA